MEHKVEPDAEETLAEATRKQGNSMNVSSIIMYKIPTSSLGELRKKFEDSGIGLDLVEFLSAMVETMDLNNQQELLQIIPDLVDVRINLEASTDVDIQLFDMDNNLQGQPYPIVCYQCLGTLLGNSATAESTNYLGMHNSALRNGIGAQ